MLTRRQKQKYWIMSKLALLIAMSVLVLLPKDFDLSVLANFNPLVTQAMASDGQ